MLEIPLNLFTNLERIDMFTVLNLLIHEHLLVLFISFIKALGSFHIQILYIFFQIDTQVF